MLRDAEFEAIGVYDPDDPHADQRLELLRYLVGLGATKEDLIANRDGLPWVASLVSIRGGPGLTLDEAAAKAGIGVDRVRRVVRAAGFPEPEADQAVLTEAVAFLAAGLTAAEAIFGEDALLQLIRVMGAAMAKVADAVVSAFLVNIEPAARLEDDVGLAVARANAEAVALLPMVPAALDVLLRQHIIAAQRTVLDADIGYESQRLVVGFVDLVGSTELAGHISLGELGSVLSTFENLAHDTVTAAGGRVVKLIGDEVMFTAPDASIGSAVALDLAELFWDHPVVPPVRCGLAAGTVMLRDGDVFGPIVNLAARAVKVAEPGEVLAPMDLAEAAGVEAEGRGFHRLKGLADEIELVRLVR